MTFPDPPTVSGEPAPATGASASVRSERASGWSRRWLESALGEPLRDGRFWLIQALVAAIAAGHLALEIGGALRGWPPLYLLPVSLFFVPVIYASVVFGQRGAIPTVLWCWILSAPSIIFLHARVEQIGVNLQLTIMLLLSLLVGRSVDAERRTGAEAAAVNARLRELNAAAIAASGSLDLDQIFTGTLAVVAHQPGLTSAWIMYVPGAWESRVLHAVSAANEPLRELSPRCLQATRRVLEGGEPSIETDVDDSTPTAVPGTIIAVAPLVAGGKATGALGVAGPFQTSPANDVEQLSAIARQLGLAVDNIRHLEAAQAALREVAGSRKALEAHIRLASDAREEERKRLARELHDETIQAVIVARFALLEAGAETPPDAKGLAAAVATLDDIIVELRRLCRDLRPSVLDDLGLAQALDALTGELSERSGMDIDLACENTGQRLEARTELILYRIAQEALHNVERHSGASHATVSLTVEPKLVTLRLIDDGCGFELPDGDEQMAEAGHLGLLGMHERTRTLGATLRIESRPGAGTRVEVFAPRP